MKILILLSLTAAFCSIDAHVRLTWPPARKYALDFLDNVRTEGPCGGAEPGVGPITTFQKGDLINVTWHLAYAHAGGYKLELLENEVVTHSLTGDDFLGVNDTTAQQADIILPADSTCENNCTLRLLRHAAEWSASTGDYLFWSCADIRVLNSSSCNSNSEVVLDVCLGEECTDGNCGCYAVDETKGCKADGGDCSNDMCECEAMFSGDFCQYKDECEDNSDCGTWGTCIDIDATSYPKKQCYCGSGWFGPNCANQNPNDLTTDIDVIMNDESYTSRTMATDPNFTLYWKMVNDGDEVEFVLHAESSTWLAIGFRNEGTDSSCQEFPAGYSSDSDAESEPESEEESDPESDVETRRRRKRSAVVRVPRAESETTPDSSDGSAYNCVSSSDGEPEPESEEEDSEPEDEPEDEPESESEGGTNLHAMDCVDMIIGTVRDGNWKIEDYYSRDRSTPRTDDWYNDGNNNLVAAAGVEMDGKTTLVFRRKRLASEMQDVSIKDENMHIIWARGQEYGEYIHSPASGIETCTATDYTFYRQDELKYHGTSSKQRGAATMNLVSTQEAQEGDCMGTYESGGYKAGWNYDEASDYITWEITTDQDGDNDAPKWLAIGISEDVGMPNTDVMVAWVTSAGELVVSDRYATAKAEPPLDDSQNVEGISGSRVNGETTVVFKRKRDTGDSQDLAFSDSDNDCYYLFFAINGGAATKDGIAIHSVNPVVSNEKVCIRACVSSGTANLPTAFAFIITCLLAMINLSM